MKRIELQGVNERISNMADGINREIEVALKVSGGLAQQHPVLGAFVFEFQRRLEDVVHRTHDILAVLVSRCDEEVEALVDAKVAAGNVAVAPEANVVGIIPLAETK